MNNMDLYGMEESEPHPVMKQIVLGHSLRIVQVGRDLPRSPSPTYSKASPVPSHIQSISFGLKCPEPRTKILKEGPLFFFPAVQELNSFLKNHQVIELEETQGHNLKTSVITLQNCCRESKIRMRWKRAYTKFCIKPDPVCVLARNVVQGWHVFNDLSLATATSHSQTTLTSRTLIWSFVTFCVLYWVKTDRREWFYHIKL